MTLYYIEHFFYECSVSLASTQSSSKSSYSTFSSAGNSSTFLFLQQQQDFQWMNLHLYIPLDEWTWIELAISWTAEYSIKYHPNLQSEIMVNFRHFRRFRKQAMQSILTVFMVLLLAMVKLDFQEKMFFAFAPDVVVVSDKVDATPLMLSS